MSRQVPHACQKYNDKPPSSFTNPISLSPFLRSMVAENLLQLLRPTLNTMNNTKYSKVEQESSDSLKLGSQDDAFSDNESGRPLSQQPRSVATRFSRTVKRSWWLTGPFLWLLSLLFTWMIASAASKSPYDVSVGLETELEPIKSHIEMYTTTFSSDLDWDENGKLQRLSRPGSKQFVGDPSPEIDANWEHITNGNTPTLLTGHPHIRAIITTPITTTITTYFFRSTAHPYATFGLA
ncbi:hypothetical protein LX36DRAFT_664794, partial [Colletotrichum falcatum]